MSTPAGRASALETASRFSDDRGRNVRRPSGFGFKAWKDILWRVAGRVVEDRIMLIAAGATFYMLLALFPALAVFVSIYGLVADPATAAQHVAFLEGLMPEAGMGLITVQLHELSRQSRDSATIGLAVAFATAYWSASNGVKTVFEALNVAYQEREKRSFIKLNLIAFTFTFAAIATAVFMIFVVGVLPAALAILRIDDEAGRIISLMRWPAMFVLIVAGISILYRYGPSRERAKWRWITWGGCIATVVWLGASAGFSYYLQNFADYNATYGSLGAVVGLMFWMWISVLILLVGAELNAEMEHQTAIDTTTGPPLPMGRRGAVVADTLGDAVD